MNGGRQQQACSTHTAKSPCCWPSPPVGRLPPTHAHTHAYTHPHKTVPPPNHPFSQVLEFITRHVPEPGAAQLAGSSVHVDLAFMRKGMPRLVDYLHYR